MKLLIAVDSAASAEVLIDAVGTRPMAGGHDGARAFSRLGHGCS